MKPSKVSFPLPSLWQRFGKTMGTKKTFLVSLPLNQGWESILFEAGFYLGHYNRTGWGILEFLKQSLTHNSERSNVSFHTKNMNSILKALSWYYPQGDTKNSN